MLIYIFLFFSIIFIIKNPTLVSSSSFNCGNIPSNTKSTILCTENGLVSGTSGGRFSDVVAFKGIPYADSSANNNRWREPQSSKKWDGVRDCSNFGSQCPQSAGNGKVDGSEDCLFLNIFTTKSALDKKSNKQSPVYFWIYGGGFSFGSANGNYGEYFASQGIVVVTINHRIGALGFMAHKALREENVAHNASGNYGLLDQIFALKWVKRNILEFGGDPENVIIGGQSSGGASVFMLALSPLASNLFKGVISQSGGVMAPNDPQNIAIAHYTVEQAESRSAKFLAPKGVGVGVTAKQLRSLPLNQIIDGTLFDFGEHPPGWFFAPALFHPNLDGYVIARTYEETMQKGLQNQVTFIVGYTNDEMGASPSFKLTLNEYKNRINNIYGKFANEFLTLYPAKDDNSASIAVNTAIREMTRISYNQLANLWLKSAKQPLYEYVWTHSPSGSERTSGACHGSDIAYFFNTLFNDKNSPEQQIANKMSSYIINFIKTKNPNDNNKLPNWEKQIIGQTTVMEVGNNFKQIPLVSDGNLLKKVDFFKRFWASHVSM